MPIVITPTGQFIDSVTGNPVDSTTTKTRLANANNGWSNV